MTAIISNLSHPFGDAVGWVIERASKNFADSMRTFDRPGLMRKRSPENKPFKGTEIGNE